MKPLHEINDIKARAYIAAIVDGFLDIEAANSPDHRRVDGGRAATRMDGHPGVLGCPAAFASALRALKYCAERMEREQSAAIRELERHEAYTPPQTVGGIVIEVHLPKAVK